MSLYAKYFYSPEADEILSERQFVVQMLRFEGALAASQAQCGIVSASAAEVIQDCCNVDYIDFEKLANEVKLGGNVAIPLVKQLTRIIKNNNVEASKYVHLGATSQDVVDSATALQIKKYGEWLDNQLGVLTQSLLEITHKHRATLMIGRTLLQQARPITFGLKTAKWLSTLSQLKLSLTAATNQSTTLKLGGAVGSGNQKIGRDVAILMAHQLGLNAPVELLAVASGGSLAALGCQLGLLNQWLGKIAKDVSLLMQTEVAEVYEGAAEGKGGSSTMPHKRNPVTCAAIIANATRVPSLVASLLAAMPQEHERSAGLWHSEWETLTELMRLTAGSVERAVELVESLEIDTQKMQANLDLTQGLIYAESVSLALVAKMGKTNAHEIVEKACKQAINEKKHLKDILLSMNVELQDLSELFKPEKAIGRSLEIIDEILSCYPR